MVFVSSPNNLKRVLIIDGGGFRGLGSLLVLEEIMKVVQSRARQALLPCDVFDLICGTSTGGLIAVLLGRLGLDCATAIEIYRKLTTSVCGNDEVVFWERFLNSMDTGLDSARFERELALAIERYAGVEGTLMVSQGGHDVLDHRKTNTFVTLTSEAPLYDNRTHCIRSYTTRSRQPSPSTHQWLICEAVRGTLASSLFLPSLFITSKHSFGDAAFAGFSSPLGFLTEEAKDLWPNDKIGIVASLGPGLSSLAPTTPRREWAATDLYAKKYVDKIMAKLPSSVTNQEALGANALNLVKRFVALAVDTEISHLEFAATQNTCIRVDPPLGISAVDLVDCFHLDQVEKTVKEWLRGTGKDYVFNIASNVVELNKEPLSVAAARFVLPPPPPATTNPGYNPQLDERRPETMIAYLKNYRVFFVIDDSGSMDGARWLETGDALLEIAEHALQQNVDEVDIRFFNNSTVYRGVKGASTVQMIFNTVRPAGGTPTGATLKVVINEHIDRLDEAVNTAAYATIKPLDIIVLTDGVPTDRPNDVLVTAVARMKAAKHHPNAVGVQIVQIGDDPEAVPALKNLMSGDVGSIVDTVPYNGQLTPQKLERILLGGLHPNIRAMIPI
ncbi:hypothetical protein D9615_007707 [Tricholomella constricta]|uniref:Uncharacterized protein n=1 Tax=Tricholomella constricta TaxID=117010 RepID=A0A8H5H490_9AGAR|nr:hypothetical protein D9615_007707 [Tricholomella constricta]